MTRLFVTRLLGVLVLATGLAVSTFAATASAAPTTGTSAPSAIVVTSGVSTEDATIQADPCGFFTRPFEAFYNHCGSNWIIIRVNFWYGASYTDIWVGPGTTNLTTHRQLQEGGFITNAWCITNC